MNTNKPTENTTLQQGYAAARLEIESLKAQLAAQQPGVAYAALPEMPPTDDRKLYNEHEPDGYLESDNDWIDRNLEAVRWFIDNHAALRASHGQAPAQPAPDVSGYVSEWAGGICTADEAMAGIAKLYGAQAAPAAVAVPSGYGPKVTVKRRCSDCKACNSESYAVQGDSGHYVYCEHPSLPERKYIGDTHWDTPDWCPAAVPTTQPAPQQEAQEPMAWQSRTRPTWGGNDRPWSPWEPCTKGLAEDCWKTPLLHDWAYEARALYTAPQPSPAAQEGK